MYRIPQLNRAIHDTYYVIGTLCLCLPVENVLVLRSLIIAQVEVRHDVSRERDRGPSGTNLGTLDLGLVFFNDQATWHADRAYVQRAQNLLIRSGFHKLWVLPRELDDVF